MIRFRKGFRSLFRGVTVEEYAELNTCADIRSEMTPEEREQAGAPEAADTSIVGGILWASIVLWQDRPLFVGIGMLCLVGSFGLKIYEIVRHLMG